MPLPEVAEDLSAETFLKLVRAQEHFNRRGSPKAWVLTIAHNVLGDWRRRSRPRQYVALMAEILGVSAGIARTRLWRALNRLRKALEP